MHWLLITGLVLIVAWYLLAPRFTPVALRRGREVPSADQCTRPPADRNRSPDG